MEIKNKYSGINVKNKINILNNILVFNKCINPKIILFLLILFKVLYKIGKEVNFKIGYTKSKYWQMLLSSLAYIHNANIINDIKPATNKLTKIISKTWNIKQNVAFINIIH